MSLEVYTPAHLQFATCNYTVGRIFSITKIPPSPFQKAHPSHEGQFWHLIEIATKDFNRQHVKFDFAHE